MVGCIVRAKWSNSIRPSSTGGRYREASSAEMNGVETEGGCDENDANREATGPSL